MPSKTGRPHGTIKHDTARERVEIRLTRHEKATLERRAAKRGVSVTEYVKLCTLSGRDE